MAVDINPLYNPYVRYRGGRTLVEPANAKPFVDRTKDFPYKIVKGDLCYRLFINMVSLGEVSGRIPRIISILRSIDWFYGEYLPHHDFAFMVG